MSKSNYILDETLLMPTFGRFLNCIIDLFIVIGILKTFFKRSSLGAWINDLGDFERNVFAIIAILVYYIMMEGLFGRTIGKFITGSVVIDKNGTKPSFRTIIKRSLCRCIPFDAFTFLGDSIHDSGGWHDSLSMTYVVNKKKLERTR
ncbi:RDD family protein [Flavobacterium sp. LHD-85]|uniref:RDD family protein n=1 Tax=Flavobacterium sp. LHD-85 TaxID=3071410 RepID=UPI0027E03ED7|nr:RDD family protein [Flavobacterium sp. LHD-85]MDQ6528114.1 RDD family protein [Flavobacterium sp. LHD-85]